MFFVKFFFYYSYDHKYELEKNLNLSGEHLALLENHVEH